MECYVWNNITIPYGFPTGISSSTCTKTNIIIIIAFIFLIGLKEVSIIVLLIYAFIHCFLHVPWLRVTHTTSVCEDDALTKELPGQGYLTVFSSTTIGTHWPHMRTRNNPRLLHLWSTVPSVFCFLSVLLPEISLHSV